MSNMMHASKAMRNVDVAAEANVAEVNLNSEIVFTKIRHGFSDTSEGKAVTGVLENNTAVEAKVNVAVANCLDILKETDVNSNWRAAAGKFRPTESYSDLKVTAVKLESVVDVAKVNLNRRAVYLWCNISPHLDNLCTKIHHGFSDTREGSAVGIHPTESYSIYVLARHDELAAIKKGAADEKWATDLAVANSAEQILLQNPRGMVLLYYWGPGNKENPDISVELKRMFLRSANLLKINLSVYKHGV